MRHERWWQEGVIYQVYPRSFQDSDGDGIGDLNGIRRRLDYLRWLGVNALWISPFYPSPMADFGYDITEYCDVDERFGTLDDFDRLVNDAHANGIRIILDFVPNHTSDRHPWFLESRRAHDSGKRNWYLWRDPKPGGGPPNNWLSNFGGSAWEFDPLTRQYYYHAFLKEQPDLNWRDPAVRDAMYDVLRFWMRRGVDGFRVDVMWHLMKDTQWRDNPVNPAFREGEPDVNRLLQVYSADDPDIHGVVREMRAVTDEFSERVLIGEIYLPIERVVAYYGKNLEGAHLPFNFQLVHASWTARTIGALVEAYEAALPAGGWPNWVLGNHDQPRIARRVGQPQARIAAMLLLTLRGTPTLYYGDEIGMTNVPIEAPFIQDSWTRNEPGIGVGRDPQRTPMQWSSGAHGGFTAGAPWLPLAQNYQVNNVGAQSRETTSLLNLYRQLIAHRANSVALRVGDLRIIGIEDATLLYRRSVGEELYVVALNFGATPQDLKLPAQEGPLRVVLSTHLDRVGERSSGTVTLRPDEGVILAG